MNGIVGGRRNDQPWSDALILEAMTAQKVGWWRRHIIYYALRLFGSGAFKKDRQLK
jgi:hypothetical protein